MPASCGEAAVVKAGKPAASNRAVQVSWLLLRTVASVSMSRFWKTSLCEKATPFSSTWTRVVESLVGASSGGEVLNACLNASVKMMAGKKLAIWPGTVAKGFETALVLASVAGNPPQTYSAVAIFHKQVINATYAELLTSRTLLNQDAPMSMISSVT
jgi:hypothetical protein